MRINKFLASAGVASRRKCDELISLGKIKVNGKVVTELGLEIKDSDKVEYENKVIKIQEEKVYYIFNKPKGCVTTSQDDRGRKTVLDYFENIEERLFCVGRLDYNTTGLLILTNDGDFANEIMHPKKHISKTYIVEVRGKVEDWELQKIREGIIIDGKKTLPAQARIYSQTENNTKIELTIFEGRNREIRKMMESINKLVVSLDRIKIGSLTLQDLSRGKYKKSSYSIMQKCFK